MTVQLSTIQDALEQRIRARIPAQYNRSDVTLNLMAKGPGKGKNVAIDVTVGTATGQIFDDGAVVSVFNNDTELLATLPWSEYGDAFKITGRAEDASAGDGTELGQLFMKKLMQARTRAAEKINTDIWTGDGTASPQKLLGLSASSGPLDSTGTYMTIIRGTHTQWAGNKFANGGIARAVSLDFLNSTLEQIGIASGKSPTYGITTYPIWRRIASLVEPERRYLQDVTIRGEKLTIQMGFNAVEVNGIPIFRDKAVPSGKFAWINEQTIGLQALPVAQTRRDRGKVMAMVPLGGTPQEQDGTARGRGGEALQAALISLPAVGNFEQWMLDATIALWCDQPNANGLIEDLGA
jgi:hypothetical protein